MAKERQTGTDTMQLEDPIFEGFEPLDDGEPEEYCPHESEPAGGGQPERQYAKAEKALTVLTGVLSVLLIIGSLVFWWYFASRLTICPLIINNYRLYGAMLICCAVVTLAATVVQTVRRTLLNLENWMLNMCVSGLITAVIMVIYNVTALGNSAEFNDVLTILCFSVSGCALPAAVYCAVRWAAESMESWIRRNESKDRAAVYSDVQAQCEGRF